MELYQTKSAFTLSHKSVVKQKKACISNVNRDNQEKVMSCTTKNPAYIVLSPLLLCIIYSFFLPIGSVSFASKLNKPSSNHDFLHTIATADSAFYAMNYETADSLYTSALETDPGNPDAHWKLARLYVSMGEALSPEKQEERQPYYEKAVLHAEASIQSNEKIADGHTWLAASLGVLADNVGPREKIKRANIIRSELDRALELNPNDDVALSILGSFNREIADMGWLEKVFAKTFLGSLPEGSREEGENMLKRAIAVNPRVIRHYHELGKLYSDMKRYTDAVAVLNEALTKPVLMKSDERRLQNIRKLIRKLSKKIDD